MSACPTGSLIEINAYDLFRERSPAMAQLARTGFDADLTKRDRKEVLPVMPFTEGLDVRSGGLAKVKRGRYAPLLFWLLGLLTFMVVHGRDPAAPLRADDVVPVQPAQGAAPEFAGPARRRRSSSRVTYRAGDRAVGLLRADRRRPHDHRGDLSDLPPHQAVPLAGVEHDVVRLPPDGRHRRPDVHRPALRAQARHLGVGARSGAW